MKLFSVFLLFTTSFMIENGVSVSGPFHDILEKYDINNNGELDVTDESFLRTELPSENGTSIVIKTESRGMLFTDADAAGDQNNIASYDELLNLIETFDEDGNAELTDGSNIFEWLFMGETEWEKFDDQYGERFSYKEK